MGFFDLFSKKNNNNDKINKLQEPLKTALSILDKKRNNALRGILIDFNFDQRMIDKLLITGHIKKGDYNRWGQEFISSLLEIIDSSEINLDEVNHLHNYISNELKRLEEMKA